MYLVKEGMTEVRKKPTNVGGLAGWLMAWMHTLRLGATMRLKTRKRMSLVETLSLGGKKQLLLVTCAGERFLVGTGSDSVQTIVRIHPESDALKRPQATAIRDLL
jgi:flagellar biogenesis protein FliO